MATIVMSGYSLGFVGCGNLGSTVLDSVVKAVQSGQGQEFAPKSVAVSVRTPASREKLSKTYGSEVEILQSNQEVFEKSDIVFLGIKPFMAADVLGAVDWSKAKKGLVLISLLAGTTIETLKELSKGAAYIVRASTNTAAKVGMGMTALTYENNDDASKDLGKSVTWLISQIGESVVVEESKQDVCIALMGSGPAFVYLFIEAMIDGALKQGLPYAVAQQAAAQVFKGAGEMVLKEGNPALLKANVMTPAGTTINGIAELERGGVRGPIIDAVGKSTEIAAKFSKK